LGFGLRLTSGQRTSGTAKTVELLTRHALAYRQLSLLLRRPLGREAFSRRHLLHPFAFPGTGDPPEARIWRGLVDRPAHLGNRGPEHLGLHSHQAAINIRHLEKADASLAD
jgi:hypothetical protein